MIVIVSLIITITLMWLGLWFHIKNPNNIWFVVAREWQTLIGAVFGFVSLAAMLILNDNFQRAQTIRQNAEYEISFLKSLKHDLTHFYGRVEQRYEPLTIVDDNPDKLDCFNFIRLASKFPIENSKLSKLFGENLFLFSPETVEVFFGIEYTRKSYRSYVNAVELGDCAVNENGVLELMGFYHERTMEELVDFRSQIDSRIMALK